MATLYDLDTLEKRVESATELLRAYRQQHDIDAIENGLKRCNCTECNKADKWLNGKDK